MLTITDVTQTLPRTAPWPKRKCAITHIIIHHTAATTDVPPETVAAWHMDPNRHFVMPGIAYHLYIRQDGRAYQCNPDDVVSWHAGNAQTGCANPNAYGIGVCLSGSFMGRVPSDAQLEAARGVVAHLRSIHGPLKIIGHQDVFATACPGDTWPQWRGTLEVTVPADPFARYPRPPEDTGAGVHMSPGANFPMGENDGLIPGILDECRRMGLRWLKLCDADGSSYNAARMCIEGGVTPVVRMYRINPYPGQLTVKQRAVAADLVRIGVRYFERGNEPNLAWEWEAAAWPGNDWNAWTNATFDALAADWLADARYLAGLGALVAVDALSGGGNYDDILYFGNILKALKRAGATQMLRESAWIACHPAGLNHPLDYPDDARNQQDHPGITILGSIPGEAPSSPSNCIRKPEKLHAMFGAEMGFDLPIIATEGGFWPGSRQDPRYPELTPQTASELTATWLRSMRTAPDWYVAAMPWCYFNRLAGNLHEGFERDAWKRVNGWGNCPASEPPVQPIIAMLLQQPCQKRQEVVPVPTPTPNPTPSPIPGAPVPPTEQDKAEARVKISQVAFLDKVATSLNLAWLGIEWAANGYTCGLVQTPGSMAFKVLKVRTGDWNPASVTVAAV